MRSLRCTTPDGPTIDRPSPSWYGARALRRLRYLPTGALGVVAAASLLALVPLSGCGPIEYINQVGVKAASAVSAAKLAQADRYAPYEYTAAEEYLHKAREEAGYAEYEDAIEFGRRAEDFANKGRAIAVARLSQSASTSATTTPASEHETPAPVPMADPKADQKTRPQNDAETPGSAKPGSAKPDSAKPDSAKPDSAKPDSKSGATE
jgi:hypothetical protein